MIDHIYDLFTLNKEFWVQFQKIYFKGDTYLP